MRNILLVAAFFAVCGFSNHPPGGSGTLVISFEPQFAGKPLTLGHQLYHTRKGDSLYIDALRFYVSSISLHGKNVFYAENDSYHLIDAEESGTQTIVLTNIPAGRYQSLHFLLGTDSLTNVSGAMGGDLDPTKGMYWAWNTGYINAKIEGRSNACPTRRHAFEFHLGGYKAPYPTARKLEIPLKNTTVRNNTRAFVRVRADLAPFFNKVHLGATHSVMIPSRQASELADCFKDIFFVQQ